MQPQDPAPSQPPGSAACALSLRLQPGTRRGSMLPSWQKEGTQIVSSLHAGPQDVGLTIVAVYGMLSIRDDAMAETQTTRTMAAARRWSSGTIWKEQARAVLGITAARQPHGLGSFDIRKGPWGWRSLLIPRCAHSLAGSHS